MSKGYIKLWRKVLDNPILREKGKRYSRLEAWLYLCLNARGTDDKENGLMRGEIQASYRFLGKVWLWSVDSVFRFMRTLEAENMVKRPEHQPERQPEHFAEHFIICNYEVYNPTPNTLPNATPNATPNETNKDKRKSNKRSAVAEEEMPRKDDPWYVVFRDVHQAKFDAPYQYQKNDFIKLWALKKSLSMTNGQIPDSWKETCEHYLSTPQGKLTLADMCLRYGIFKRSPLNQFNRPTEIMKPAAEKPTAKVQYRIGSDGKKVAYVVPA
jgi:hypothetical protein